MNRVSLAFVSLFVGACTEGLDVRPTIAPPVSPVAGIAPPPSDDTGHDSGQLDPAGNVVASRGIVLAYGNGFVPRAVLDTHGTDTFASVAIDPGTQRVLLAARTNGATWGTPSYGGYDYVIGELAAAGFRPAQRGYFSTPEHPRQLAAGGGLVAVAGHEERLMADGATWIDPFLATFAADGELTPQWMTSRRHADTERYTAVDVSDEAVVVGGTIADGESPGMFLLARDHNANAIWQRRVSTVGSDELAAIRMLPGGDLLLAGTTTATLGEAAQGGADIVVGRLDGATGAARWIAQVGTAGDEHAADLAVDESGHIYVTGDVRDTTDRDALFLVLDDAGRVQLEQRWTSPGDDVAAAVAVDACGTAVVVGHTTGELAGPSRGGRDGFVIVTR